VLCVIVRQTLGWKRSRDAGRKHRDWLTQSQLMRRTGRNSEAVSHAVQQLVRRDLIEVTDYHGAPLTTPSLRRRHRGALYFSLRRNAGSYSKTEHRKANTTKETPTKRKGGWSKAFLACRIPRSTAFKDV